MKTRFTALITIASTVVVLATAFIPALSSAAIVEPGFEREVVATGFVLPDTVAFATDGRIFVGEKGGNVRVVKNGVLLAEPVLSLTDVNTYGDRGLLGIALDPSFASNGYIYLSYTFENTPGTNVGGAKTGRIARMTVVGDSALESSKLVLVGTVGGSAIAPSCEDVAVTADCIPSDSLSHSVGGLRFGPDGKLYATLGDGANFDYADVRSLRAQNLDSLAGKVLRINADGSAPVDNPFFNGNTSANRSKVYALGVRNSFRLNFNPTNGRLYAGDVGWSSWEEVNQIVKGANYGWPCWEGASLTSHNCVASTTAPIHFYAHDINGAGSVTAGAFSTNNAYPDAYDTSFFFGDYAQNFIKRLVLDLNGNFVSVQNFMDDPDGPVDISTGPDGNIYYLSIYTGTLSRITHTTGNRRPVVQMSATPTAGLTPLNVTFSSAGTYDPDGDAFTFSWNFGDGAVSNVNNPSHTYSANGSYSAVLTVADINGAAASKSMTITVGNQKPVATITSPVSGALYAPGDVVQMQATGTDAEDGTLTSSAFNWQVVLHHNTHVHVIQTFTGIQNPWFVAPDHDAADVYVEVVLTVTDSAGLTSTNAINLYRNNGGGVGNLIQNESVEIPEDGVSGNPLKWLRGNYGVSNSTFSYPVTGLFGAKALRLTVSGHVDGSSKWFFTPVVVTPGQQYIYSDYYTATVPTEVYAQFALSNGTYQYALLGTPVATPTATKVQYQFTVPALVQSVTVFHQLSANGTLTTDNFSLVQVTAGADTTPPSLSISSPTTGSTVSSTTTVSVMAGDSGGMAGVTLLIDGVPVLSEDVTSPYEFIWDSFTVANGSHTISARARDIANNVATATPITVSVSNATTVVNLIQNGTLETQNGALPLGWTSNGWGNHTRTFSYPVVGYNGGKAARTEITSYAQAPTGSGDSKWVFQKIAIIPGRQYTYSDHYRSNTISDIIGQYTMSDGSFHYFGLAKEIQPTTTWATISAPFTPPANATHITLFHLISAVGYVEIDDAAMYEVGVGTPSETNVPIVEFTNPLNGQTVSGSVTLTASSTDDTAVTYIFYAVDGIPITGQITAPPYSYVWDTTAFAAGVHTIKATTHDPSGNNSTHTISVTVDNTTPPPAAGNLVQNPSFETVGATTDPAQWSRGGWGTNNRTYTYPVTGFDGLKAARVAITSFTNGDAKWYFTDVPVTAGQTYVVSHRYKSDAATEVLARFTLPGGVYQYQFLGSVASAPAWTVNSYSVLAPANASALTIFHVLHSVGTLDVDDFSVTPPGATLDTVAPSVVLTGPINNATVTGITTVSASSSDATAVAGVALVVDGVVQGAEDTTSPYSFAWDTSSASNGPHSLAARSRDTVGNVATSSAIAVTVSNGAGLQSLIANPSLSVVGTPGNPANWTRNSWGTNTTIFTYPVVGPTDTSAARIEMTSFTDGDAKWRHDDVPVTPGVVYTFTHEYRASVLTNLTARYTLANGTYQYISLGNFPAAAAWTPITQTFTAPVNATSVTILHILNAVGSLETDNYALTTGNTNQFANGMISLTFDDGWLSHYTAALPILNAANVKGVFHIVSQETLNAVPVERIVNASLEADAGNGNPAEWSRGGWGTNAATFTYPVQGFVGASAAKVEIASYTDGDAKWYFTDVPVQGAHSYVLKDSYNSNVSTEIVLRVMRTGGVTQYMFLATLPSTAGAWANFNQTVVMPTDATSVTLFHVIHSTGSLTVDNYSVKHVQDFVDAAQMMAMQSSGHEISGHTQTHADLTTLAPADAQAQLTNSRSDLISLGATPVSTMAYPYGAFNTNVQQMARNAGFVAARGVEHGYNTRASDKFGLLIQRMDRTVTLATVQGWINQAKLDNTWLILMFHQIDDVQTETLGVSAQLLSDTVNAVVTSGIEVVNLQTGVSRMNP